MGAVHASGDFVRHGNISKQDSQFSVTACRWILPSPSCLDQCRQWSYHTYDVCSRKQKEKRLEMLLFTTHHVISVAKIRITGSRVVLFDEFRISPFFHF